MLRDDFIRFPSWCGELGLSLNLSKCKVMPFSRVCSPVTFSYPLDRSDIMSVYDSVMDLATLVSYSIVLKYIF